MIDDNFDEYQKKLDKINLSKDSRYNLPQPDHQETLAELIAEGFRLLAEEEKEKKTKSPVSSQDILGHTPKSSLEDKLGSMSDNPYIRARCEILKKMSAIARNEIEKMEKNGNINNRLYNDFVKNVRIRGDQLAEQN